MTCSQLSCLIELYRLSGTGADVASVKLTKNLGLSKPSVHRLLEGLRGMELIEKEYYGAARLTQKGAETAQKMLDRANELSKALEKGMVSKEKSFFAALTLLSSLDADDFDCFNTTDKEAIQ